jgi:hypothetical protein
LEQILGGEQATYFDFGGGGQDTDLMLSACHKTTKNALKYKNDTALLLSLA